MTNPVDTSNLPFEILAAGRFTPAQLHVLYQPTPRATTPELDALIQSEWTIRKAEADAAGRLLFNGALLRYLSHDAQPDRFQLNVGPTNYQDFLGTNLYQRHRLNDFGWHRFSNPVGTTATLIAEGGMLIFGRRSNQVAWHAGYLHTFGGALEEIDRGDAPTVDAFAAVRRELTEEAALAADDIKDLICVGLVRDREIHQPELLFEARINLPFAELLHRWRTAESANEHIGLAAVETHPAIIAPFLIQHAPIAPVAAAAIFIHGLHAWGADWFSKTANAWDARAR